MDNVETTIVALTVGDDTNTTHVTTTSDHGDNTSVELDEVGDLAGSKVNLDSVVDLDQGVGVTDAIDTKISKLCSIASGSYKFLYRPPPINQSLVQRLNDTENFQGESRLTFSHRA